MSISSPTLVDEKGNIAYYSKVEMKEGEQREFAKQNLRYQPISAADRAMMETAMRQLMSELKAEQLFLEGKPVPYLLNIKNMLAKS